MSLEFYNVRISSVVVNVLASDSAILFVEFVRIFIVVVNVSASEIKI